MPVRWQQNFVLAVESLGQVAAAVATVGGDRGVAGTTAMIRGERQVGVWMCSIGRQRCEQATGGIKKRAEVAGGVAYRENGWPIRIAVIWGGGDAHGKCGETAAGNPLLAKRLPGTMRRHWRRSVR